MIISNNTDGGGSPGVMGQDEEKKEKEKEEKEEEKKELEKKF